VDDGRVYKRFGATLVLALVATNLYRAWTQSITCDEAFTYNEFLAGPVSRLFTHYDANHHILHSMLAKIAISLFGLSEFTLRIPSLLGGVLYLSTAFRLCRYLFGESLFFLVSLASVTLNPFVLDFLSAARGYGLALAFCLWALYHLCRFAAAYEPGSRTSQQSHLYKAALGLALSVSSHVAFLFPCGALAALLVLMLAVDGLLKGNRSSLGRQLSRAADQFLLPGLVTAFLIMVLPLSRASQSAYYYGADSLSQSLDSILRPAFFHHRGRALSFDLFEPAFLEVMKYLVPGVFLLAGAVLVAIVWRWIRARGFRKLSRPDQFLYYAGGGMLVALAGMVASHKAFGLLYPQGRTGLYWVPLFLLTCAALLKRFEKPRVLVRIARVTSLFVAGLVLAQFIVHFDTTHYAEWVPDSGVRQIVDLMRADHARHPKDAVRLAASWTLEPSLNFYRQRHRLAWMDPIRRESLGADSDYFVLLPRDVALIEKLRLTKLYQHGLSGAVLAVRREPGR